MAKESTLQMRDVNNKKYLAMLDKSIAEAEAGGFVVEDPEILRSRIEDIESGKNISEHELIED